MARRRPIRLIPRLLIPAALILLATSPVVAQELGATKGEVTFRVTLSGPVDTKDAFVVFTRCDDEWCDETTTAAYPVGQSVVACGIGLADAPVCSATTYEWTVDLATGPLEYDFVRIRDNIGEQEFLVQHSGTWQIHAGHQVISLGYVYPGGMLPNMAVATP